MTRLFLSLIRGMSEHELLALSKCGLGSPGVYIYDFQSASAYTPNAGEIAWPVEYLFSRHHRKHVFVPRKPPSLSEVGRALMNWDAKIRWKFHFWQSPDSNPWKELFSKGQNTAWCNTPIPAYLEDYIAECKKQVFDSCKQARSCFFHARHKLSNLNGVCRLALEILQKGETGACKTDKDGGFVLVKKQDVLKLCFANMTSKHYEPVIFDEELNANIGRQYLQAAQLVARAQGDQRLQQVLLSDYRTGKQTAKSFLDLTIKTHKPQGEVAPRAIHSSATHPFAPGMRWLSHELRKHLQHTHLIRDTRDLIRLLSSRPVPHDHVLVKIDIKDFFMSGQLPDLIDICSQYFDPAVREAGISMLRAVLYNQYISIPGHGETWCTVQGSGMGLISSGDVSDLCFYHMVDAFLLESNTVSRFDISVYARYRDDAFLVLGGSRSMRLQLLGMMKSKSKFSNSILRLSASTRPRCSI